jgi:hypothetical protein
MNEINLSDLKQLQKPFSDYYVDLEKKELYSLRTGKLKKMKTDSVNNVSQYSMNSLVNEATGKSQTFTIHAIMKAARENVPINSWRAIGLTIHHRNSQKNDNDPDNLEWTSRFGQYRDDTKEKMRQSKLGKPRYKVTKDDVLVMRKGFKDYNGSLSAYCHDIAESYDMTFINAYYIMSGKTWKNVG